MALPATVRSRLAWGWLGGGGAIVSILVVQSLMGKFGSSVQQVQTLFRFLLSSF